MASAAITAKLIKKVCVQLPTSPVNVTLLALAAEQRAVAPLLLGAWWPPPSPAANLPHAAAAVK